MLIEMRESRSFASLLASVLTVTVTWSGAPRAAEVDTARAAEVAEQIRGSLQAIEDGAREAPRDRWDPQYVVDQVGLEPAALSQWVRDNVRWVAYHGALRGPQGVLMDRVGNSLDQALLLSALLQHAGVENRLAHAKLAGAPLEDLWSRVSTPAEPVGSETPPSNSTSGTLAETAELYGIEAVPVAQQYADIGTQSVGLIEQLEARATLQARELAALANVSAEGGAANAAAQYRKMLADHYWVQARSGSEWIDLDPLARTEGEAVFGTAAATLDAAALPTTLEHTVSIRVVTEQLKDGRLSEQVALEQTVLPRQLIGERIHFMHVPVKWPADWPEVLPDTVQVKLRAALYTQKEWLPALVIGSEAVRRASIFDTGALNENPNPASPFQNMATAMFGNLAKATDVLASGADDTVAIEGIEGDESARPPNPEGELTAEWLELAISRPGEKTRILRREMFDLVGPAARALGDVAKFKMSEAAQLTRAMAMLGESWIEIMPAKIAPEFVMHLVSENALANKPLLEEIAADPFSKLPANYMETMAKVTAFPASLHIFANLRFASSAADLVYLDRPTIVAQHTTLTRGGGGDFVPRTAIDIIENGVGVEPSAAADAFAIRLAQGVADTNAEALAIAQSGTVIANTAEAFVAADGAWTSVTAADAAALAALKFPADLAARIAADINDGSIAVVPRDPLLAQSAGWWRVDPRDGTTLGVAPNGHGVALVEYAFVLIIQGIIAAAVCMIQEAGVRAIEKEVSGTKVANQVLGAAGGAFTKQNAFKCSMTGVGASLQMATMGAAMAVLQGRMLRGQMGGKSTNSSGKGPSGPRADPNVRGGMGGVPRGVRPSAGSAGGPSAGGVPGPVSPQPGRTPQSGKTLSTSDPGAAKTLPGPVRQSGKTKPGTTPTATEQPLPPTERAPSPPPKPSKPALDDVRQALQKERQAMDKLNDARGRNAPQSEIDPLASDYDRAAKARNDMVLGTPSKEGYVPPADRSGSAELALDQVRTVQQEVFKGTPQAPAPYGVPIAGSGKTSGASSLPPTQDAPPSQLPLTAPPPSGYPGKGMPPKAESLPAPVPLPEPSVQQAGQLGLSATLKSLTNP